MVPNFNDLINKIGGGGGSYSASFSSGTKSGGPGFNAKYTSVGASSAGGYGGGSGGYGGGSGGYGSGSGGIKTSQTFQSSGDQEIALAELFNQNFGTPYSTHTRKVYRKLLSE